MSGIGPVEKYLVKQTRQCPICAALIDPEDFSPKQAAEAAERAIGAGAKVIMIGGSTISEQSNLDEAVKSVKEVTGRITTSPRTSRTPPVILFPGNTTGVSKFADAILFSSLLNSTNPYFITGAQALGSMSVYKSKIESIPMGYLVFGSGSSAGFIGQANSLPSSKPSLAVIYALAAKYLGMRTLYLEGGSGASEPVSPEVIHAVRSFYDGILIVGGGITTKEIARGAAQAGADLLVIGNMLQTSRYENALRQITSALSLHSPK